MAPVELNKQPMRLLTILLIVFSFLTKSKGQELKYSVCNDCWSADSLGNHRAVVDVKGAGKVAQVKIVWRRRDDDPESKTIIITDRKGHIIKNLKREHVTREYGSLLFEPKSGETRYYVYYLKYWTKGRSNYPTVVYPSFKETASAAWLKSTTGVAPLKAVVVGMEFIDEFNSFYPMEVIATKVEAENLKGKSKDLEFLLFPEDRMHAVRMKNDLPHRWVMRGPGDTFSATVDKGENFSFQIGLYAHARKLEDIKVTFSDLNGSAGSIAAGLLSCINTSGVGWDGLPFQKELDVEKGEVQPLWCLLAVPESYAAGEYVGTATIRATGTNARKLTIRLKVSDKVSKNGGVEEPWKQTRLTWLNSTLASTDEIIAPYEALDVKGNSVSLLGRKMEVGDNGLPKQVLTYFSPLMTKLDNAGKPLLTNGFDFQVSPKGRGPVKWTQAKKPEFHNESNGVVNWMVVNNAENLRLEVIGRLEFDGFAFFSIKMTSLRDQEFDDMQMRIPMQKSFSKYMMGLGLKGGLRPSTHSWTWDVANKNQDGAWIGDVNGGMQFSLRAENYSRPLNTNFYLQKPLNLPSSWGNQGKGGIQISDEGTTTWISAFSGTRSMKAGESLNFNFTLLITPFHTLDTDFQWKTRFYHRYSPVDTIVKRRATVVNIHHANEINPYINYPFLRTKEMKAYIDESHQKGLKVKIYNTVRELSNRAYETPALRSLGTEIYSPGNGGGYSWLQEHLGTNYIAAWFVPELKDAAVINSGMSRWHNYYVEGMSWLVKNVGIDGIYLDDVAFDRTTMKRIRRVLNSDRGPGIIDLHSANQYNKRDGFNNSANLYMEHFPYINRLWFGEYFDYDSKPDFWMTEVSGIPFGLMGEMLEKGGNPWRGMVYGMTNRMPWTENSDPRHLWKVWDDFGMQGTEMIGYWVEQNPVKTDNAEVITTIYKKKDAVLVSLASWANEDVTVRLVIDWKGLGMKPSQTMTAPAVKGFQAAQSIGTGDKFLVPKGQGLLLIIK